MSEEHEPTVEGYCGETDIIPGCICGWRQPDRRWDAERGWVADGPTWAEHLPDSLDAAWAEAEAALPEGWAFDLSRAVRPPAEGAAPTYYATVSRPWTTGAIEFQVSGPTPAAALRALAAKLREAQG